MEYVFMAYEWTDDDRARLTAGCSAEYDGERREVVSWEGPDWAGRYRVRLEGSTFWLGDIDPASIAPPTLATLNRMAAERLGDGAVVYVSDDCELTVQHDRSGFAASFCSRADRGATAARECAQWLAARGR
jgi:hypothetical protein